MPANTTKRVKHVINALILNQQNYGGLTPVQQAKGTKALKHNQFDVQVLPKLHKAIEECDPHAVVLERVQRALHFARNVGDLVDESEIEQQVEAHPVFVDAYAHIGVGTVLRVDAAVGFRPRSRWRW